jgi:hypothetical protein
MSGSATLDPNVLVDSLVPDVIDGLRRELHPLFGVRAFDVSLVTRSWSGGEIGRGDPSDTEVLIDPQPLVHPFSSMDFEMEPCGLDEAGWVKLTEVSLTYTHDELLAGAALDGVEHLIKISEAHGQGQPDRFFVHKRPPYPDRIKDMGWVLYLEVATQ